MILEQHLPATSSLLQSSLSLAEPALKDSLFISLEATHKSKA
jgi:hypothetical protein